MGMKTLIPAEKARDLPLASFQPFERRPVNYYVDVFSEEDRENGTKLNEQEMNARLESLLAAERQKLQQKHEQELLRQFEAGLEKGRTEAGSEVKRGIELLSTYAKMLQAEKKELADRSEKSTVELAFLLAQRILGAELQSRPEAVADVVRNALRQVLDCDQVRLRVNDADIDYLRSVQGDLENVLSQGVKLEIRTDSSIERGGCMIDTERGTLDARIFSQLDTLRAGMNDAQTASGA
ncbi:hypothetical protein EHM69_09535 [candidate division KSB1 bacterium]|nr:MAG: hypothetical protein EHM69_09535 [candidate division KSB1 bacterium]